MSVHAAFMAPGLLAVYWIGQPEMRAAMEVSAKARRGERRQGDFSPRTIAALFVLLSVVAALPVLTNPLPPLSDYINHLARMHVITAIGPIRCSQNSTR
ncbi:MAG: hypothetical protein IPK23_01730 [Rhizobiales bacterium]|nr:hypothetical protein [Hyphomicrobiales bacterium]